MIHDGRSRCHCGRCNNLRHERMTADIKAEVTRKYRRDVYIGQVVQYRGKTVNENGQAGPWVNAGMAVGTFDLFVCARGRVVWLDTKTGGGKLTPEQLQFQAWIRAAGGTAEPVRSPEHAIAVIEGAMAS